MVRQPWQLQPHPEQPHTLGLRYEGNLRLLRAIEALGAQTPDVNMLQLFGAT